MIPTLCTGFHNVYVLMGCSTSTQMNLRLPERAESTLHEDVPMKEVMCGRCRLCRRYTLRRLRVWVSGKVVRRVPAVLSVCSFSFHRLMAVLRAFF